MLYRVNARFLGEDFFGKPTDNKAVALHDFYDASWMYGEGEFSQMLMYCQDNGSTELVGLKEMGALDKSDADEWVAAIIRYETFLKYELQAWLNNACNTRFIDQMDDENFETYPEL